MAARSPSRSGPTRASPGTASSSGAISLRGPQGSARTSRSKLWMARTTPAPWEGTSSRSPSRARTASRSPPRSKTTWTAPTRPSGPRRPRASTQSRRCSRAAPWGGAPSRARSCPRRSTPHGARARVRACASRWRGSPPHSPSRRWTDSTTPAPRAATSSKCSSARPAAARPWAQSRGGWSTSGAGCTAGAWSLATPAATTSSSSAAAWMSAAAPSLSTSSRRRSTLRPRGCSAPACSRSSSAASALCTWS
mmetsp:Transcript_52066/g.166023  ORF Transcript_52066/g.166023 Transcript_52066/m.166023 type:complete len:251 (+) Transcript_52066:899-1651(+)